jgi:hypothetical protein
MGGMMKEEEDTIRIGRMMREDFLTMDEEKLPGFMDFIRSSESARETLKKRFIDIERAANDVDKILYDQSLNSYRAAWWRVNEIIAEQYRKENKDPELWELRYIKFMKIKFIKFESDLGEFYLVPFEPKNRPRSDHWYTVDEMIAICEYSGKYKKAMECFGQLPARPKRITPPPRGEKHLYITQKPDGTVESRYHWTRIP